MKNNLLNIGAILDVDEENCNDNYTLPERSLWVQHHTEADEWILYDKDSNQIGPPLANFNDLQNRLMNIDYLGHLSGIKEVQEAYLVSVFNVLNGDPMASDGTKKYASEELSELLLELMDKEGSLLRGILTALERHLEK